ncbi:MAG TPA: MoaD/ThiS family protein [Nitrososphaeraceae archaeon]|jgi:molybdopterin converting factor small subunit|nr:MoaD/ThiS family protein [Nitrososphaeraceae archaeon]
MNSYEYRTLRIQLFGILREKLKSNNLIIPIQDNSISLKELGKYLKELYPSLYTNEINFVFAVNKVIRNENVNVTSSDEITIIPPISGG